MCITKVGMKNIKRRRETSKKVEKFGNLSFCKLYSKRLKMTPSRQKFQKLLYKRDTLATPSVAYDPVEDKRFALVDKRPALPCFGGSG